MTNYSFCGKPVLLGPDGVYKPDANGRRGKWLGHLYTDEYGTKYVLGPENKGKLDIIN